MSTGKGLPDRFVKLDEVKRRDGPRQLDDLSDDPGVDVSASIQADAIRLALERPGDHRVDR